MGMTATAAGTSIIGALALIGVMLVACGALVLIKMFSGVGSGMGRGGQSNDSSTATMTLGAFSIMMGSIFLLVSYLMFNPLFTAAGA
jgi:hypothetical protein